ncbi:TrkH family potassium uptake protein [Corynebacterium ulceribovis]|uniref:TrkH family potassium uptake protein n=1 Tax=Corynebacterium ulceribovis TaxID=487732 RepID=UPI00047824A8|nr:potassium transporter TrkG [Corynebacterium ulceribovis]
MRRELSKSEVNLGPTRIVALAFLTLIVLGTALLMLPISASSGDATDVVSALFTATSATCLTGLIVVDTATHWSAFGQIVVLSLIQLGGFGIMSLTSLAGMLLTGRIGLRSRLNASAEGRTLSPADVRRTIIATLVLTAVMEVAVACFLTFRFALGYDMSVGRAIYEGIFHSISAFNNAGFGLRSDNLIPYVGDAWIILPISASLVIGGLGFPVLSELLGRARNWLRRGEVVEDRKTERLSVTAKVTLIGTAILLTAGIAMVAVLEWNWALAELSTKEKVFGAFFQGVTPRTAGFNSVDYADFHPTTLMGTDILMFIGGGSAGTAGGLKITTFAVLVAAIVAEFRSREVCTINQRSIDPSVVRQALAVAFAGITVVIIGIGALRILEPAINGDFIVFEVISAFATSGLSTGITAELSTPSKLILCFIMYFGRVGPITLVTALGTRKVAARFQYPKERPFIG